LSLIRKVFWPAIIALGVLAVMAAMGNGNTRIAHADSDEFCGIEGPKVITVGKTYLYIGRLDHWDGDLSVQVSIDNIIGNSKITSFVDGDFNFGDYKKVGPTNVVNDLDIEDVFNIDDDLLDFFAMADGFNTPIAAFSSACGNLSDTLTEMIVEAIDRGNACNFFVTFTTSCWVQGNLNATVVAAQSAVTAATNAYNNALAAQVAATLAANPATTNGPCKGMVGGDPNTVPPTATADPVKCANALSALTAANNLVVTTLAALGCTDCARDCPGQRWQLRAALQ
jgi:hypothetical protein